MKLSVPDAIRGGYTDPLNAGIYLYLFLTNRVTMRGLFWVIWFTFPLQR